MTSPNYIQLHHGDCLQITPQIPDHSVDLILFDPPFLPYGEQTEYKQIREENINQLDQIKTPTIAEYPLWWDRLCQETARILKPSGYFIYKADDWTSLNMFPISSRYFKYYKTVVWDKGKIGLGRKVRMQHEIIVIYATKDSCAHYWKYPTIMQTEKPFYKKLDGTIGKNISKNKTPDKKGWHGKGKGIAFPSILKIPVVGNGVLGAGKQNHINQTPPPLWIKFIDYFCPPNGIIVDYCMGTGSVGLANLELNNRDAQRIYIGIEYDKEHYKKAKSSLLPTKTVL